MRYLNSLCTKFLKCGVFISIQTSHVLSAQLPAMWLMATTLDSAALTPLIIS